MKHEVFVSSKTDCWNTPAHVLQDVYEFFDNKLELDPCSNSLDSPNVKASVHFDEGTNGLTREWNYQTVFMNHPYSQSKMWVPYALNQWNKYNNEMLLLIKLDVSTQWWRHIALKPWLAYNKRLKFGDSNHAAPFQSAMIYLGSNLEKFIEIFSKNGFIYLSH